MFCELSVIIPAYLEEENLRLLLPRIKEHCSQITSNFEILIIDTTTQMDGTFQACEELGVTYLNRKTGNSYGDAVRTGIQHSKGKKVLFMDADGSHPPSVINELYQHGRSADVVVASRYVEGGFTENSKILVFMSWVVNTGYRLVLGLKCKDVSTSFKLYPGDALRSLKLTCNNFDIIEEILFKLVRGNPKLIIKEIPSSFKKRMFGKTKRNLIAFIFTYIITLIRLRFS